MSYPGMKKISLDNLSGLTPDIRHKLHEHGIESVGDLFDAEPKDIVEWVGEEGRAKAVKALVDLEYQPS